MTPPGARGIDAILEGQPIPVHVNAPSVYNPIHDSDIAAMLPAMLAAASVPTTIVNWGGDDPVSIEDYCRYAGQLLGVEPKFRYTEDTYPANTMDTTHMHEVLGPCEVGWKEGFRRLLQAKFPDRVLQDAG